MRSQYSVPLLDIIKNNEPNFTDVYASPPQDLEILTAIYSLSVTFVVSALLLCHSDGGVGGFHLGRGKIITTRLWYPRCAFYEVIETWEPYCG
jgi:hypothetical protein